MTMSREEMEQMVKAWLQTVEQITRSEGLPVVPDEKTADPLWVDVRELRLKYLIPIKRVKKFFDGLKEGKVYATRCPVKNIYYFPPQADCPVCMDENLEWVEVSGRGQLLTYTVIQVKPASYMHYPDYVIAIARMDEGFNILCWMAVEDPATLKVGMHVKLVVKRREPEGFLTYYLEPA
ncbi:MAG: Zn-ribbon domain-containing OB-fold protein [Candidatus Caldarchaeum sp.]|nr:Zn-ribbon domain-containing OB-fold protein [Candidatus Caldarchaeum sp.]MDW7978778.1 Zn-ribbon domain-containing OB-fold protein [Candidatus Caldarchaeum sp.]MDW8359251.1 Zn-ribbon domain-containing OB-fold protein [Candidatus Caldarchaeum sp.]